MKKSKDGDWGGICWRGKGIICGLCFLGIYSLVEGIDVWIDIDDLVCKGM